MPDEMGPTNGTEWRREDTQTRVRIQTAKDEWIQEWFRKVVVLVAAVGGVGAIASASMYAAGRASADSLQETDAKVIRVEQVTVSQQRQIDEVRASAQSTEKRAEERHYRLENKVDIVLDQLRPMAVRSGAPVVPRPPHATIKPAPPEREETR